MTFLERTWVCAINFSGFEYTLGLIQQEVEKKFSDSSLSALNIQGRFVRC